jgi:PAS domain-containing protein
MYDPENYKEDNGVFLKRLEIIFNAVPSTIILVDINGRPLFINEQGIQLFGLNKGKPDTDSGVSKSRGANQSGIISTFSIKTYLSDGTPFAPNDMPISRSLNNGEIIRHSEVLVENIYGVRIPVLFISLPIRDSNGDVTSAFIVLENMTERKQVIEKLNFQKRLLSNVKDAIAVYDRNKKIIYWNEAAEKV